MRQTAFVERLLGALDAWVVAVRCRRDESLGQARESTGRLLADVSDVVVIEGDSPLRDSDLRVFVAPPPAVGQTLLVHERRDRAAQQRARAAAMERLLGEPDGAARLLEQLVGGSVVAFVRERPELLEQARQSLLAGIGKVRSAPPGPSAERWTVATGCAGIEHAQLVVVNIGEDARRGRAPGAA